MFRKAFNFIKRRRWKKKRRSDDDTEATTVSRSERSLRQQRPHMPRRTRTTPATKSSASASSSTTPSSTPNGPKSPDGSSSISEVHSTAAAKKAGSLLLARRRKMAAASKALAEQQTHTTIGRKSSSEEDAGKEESRERKDTVLDLGEKTQEVSKRVTAPRRRIPERSKRVMRSRRVTKDKAPSRPKGEIGEGSKRIMRSRRDFSRKTRAKQGVTRMEGAEPTQEEMSMRGRSQKVQRRRQWGEQAATQMVTTTIDRNKLNTQATTETKDFDLPPLLPPAEKSASEVTDYWLTPDGKPKKEFEISFIPSHSDMLLQKPGTVTAPPNEDNVQTAPIVPIPVQTAPVVPVPVQTAPIAPAPAQNAPTAPTPAAEAPKFVPQAYGVLDRPPPVQQMRPVVQAARVVTARPNFPQQPRGNATVQETEGTTTTNSTEGTTGATVDT